MIVLGTIALRVPETMGDAAPDLDWPGTLLTTAGLGAVVFSLLESVPAIGGAGALLLVVFVGINNAVSRVASLLAVAVFGIVLSTTFNRELDRRIANAPEQVRRAVVEQRGRLAGIETGDPHARRDIQESFVAGYRRVLWETALLSVASALSAATFIERRRPA